jgi:hypothetical protein
MKALIGAALILAAELSMATAAHGGIYVCERNPRYWQYGGEPLLLLGGSVEDNLFQIPDLEQHLDALAACGGNYVRCTMSSRDEGNVWPFARVGDRYDLDRWNEEYWLRFATFLEETRRRGIIVQVEVWATFDYYRDNWARNPFNPKNNRNYTAAQTGLPVLVDSHPTRTENAFFWSVPAEQNRTAVLAYQQRFVDELLAYSLAHDHVLYCMDNETSVTPAWGAYWAAYIREAAPRADRTVHVTEMWDPWDLGHPMHANTIEHPETYTFVDISQNNHNAGRRHYENALAVRRRTADRPRPINNVKVYGADGGRFGSTRDGVERFWRNVFAGAASARFHRPTSGIGLSPLARRMIKGAREVTDAFELVRCEPRPDLIETPAGTEAYCLAEPGRQYALYFPRGGGATLALEGGEGEMALRWYDVEGGQWGDEGAVQGGGSVDLACPGDGQWAAVLRRRRDDA